MAIVGSSKGLRSIVLPKRTRNTLFNTLKKEYGPDLILDKNRFRKLEGRIKLYLSGQKVKLNAKIDMNYATDFDKEVWQAVKYIPWGKVRTYSEIARRIGRPKSMRAVGNVLSSNRIPLVIPCHRVITKNRGIGGFNGGIELKKKLLRIERNEI